MKDSDHFDTEDKQVSKSLKIPIASKILVASMFILGYTIYRIFYVTFDNHRCIQDTYL